MKSYYRDTYYQKIFETDRLTTNLGSKVAHHFFTIFMVFLIKKEMKIVSFLKFMRTAGRGYTKKQCKVRCTQRCR